MVDRTLSIDIALEIHQPGVNPRWREEVEVPIPPDYAEQDILPFVRHELERAVTVLEIRDLGEARAAKIMAAYELRARVVRILLRRAARDAESQALVARVRDVLDMDNDELFQAWGNERLGD